MGNPSRYLTTVVGFFGGGGAGGSLHDEIKMTQVLYFIICSHNIFHAFICRTMRSGVGSSCICKIYFYIGSSQVLASVNSFTNMAAT
jgi:hypothetical protein